MVEAMDTTVVKDDTSEKRKRKLFLRWSIFTAILIALFWTAYYYIFNTVPEVNQMILRRNVDGSMTALNLPVSISCWLDIMGGPLWSIIIISILMHLGKTKIYSEITTEDGHGRLICLSMIGIIIGSVLGVVCGLNLGLVGLIPLFVFITIFPLIITSALNPRLVNYTLYFILAIYLTMTITAASASGLGLFLLPFSIILLRACFLAVGKIISFLAVWLKAK